MGLTIFAAIVPITLLLHFQNQNSASITRYRKLPVPSEATSLSSAKFPDVNKERNPSLQNNLHTAKCKDMITTGQWVNFTYDQSISKKESPYTGTFTANYCQMKNYFGEGARKCFEGKSVTFIGDSRSRQLMLGMNNVMKGMNTLFDNKTHANIKLSYSQTFMWSTLYSNRGWDLIMEKNSPRREEMESAFEGDLLWRNSDFDLILVGEQTAHALTNNFYEFCEPTKLKEYFSIQ